MSFKCEGSEKMVQTNSHISRVMQHRRCTYFELELIVCAPSCSFDLIASFVLLLIGNDLKTLLRKVKRYLNAVCY